MPDGVRGHNVACPITHIFILLMLGLLPPYAHSLAAPLGKQAPQPMPVDTAPVVEEQILST
ncbi:MAG: hypothetical protein ACXW34_02075, partial [Nitrospira sp.]